MRTDFLFTRLAVVAALFLVLGTMVACNDHDDASDGEAVVEVTATTLTGNETAGTAVFATLSLKLQDRSGIANSFFNDVLFTSYTVSSTTAVDINGLITTNACPIGGTCELTLEVVGSGDSLGTGGVHHVVVQVQGMDLNGNPVSFTHQIAVSYGVVIPVAPNCDTGTGFCTAPPASVGISCTSDADC
jgi:hypothetical protein